MMRLSSTGGRISEEEGRQRLRADEQRPLDLAMLNCVCDAYEDRLGTYSQMLRTVIEIATDRRNPDICRHREIEVDCLVDHLKGNMGLWKEHIKLVFEFLTELRASSGQGPVRLRERSHATALMLAESIWDTAAQGWKCSKEVALRSRTDRRYIRQASACELFFKGYLKTLPMPNDLQGLMDLERAAGRKALRDAHRAQLERSEPTGAVSIQAEKVEVTGRTVSVTGEKTTVDSSVVGRRQDRMKREVAEPLIRKHLEIRPHDTAEQVSKALECSVGVVAESAAWKENQKRLKLAKREGVPPAAVRLSIERNGESKDGMEWLPDKRMPDPSEEASQRENELLRLIGQHRSCHPNATTAEIVSALADHDCTAGDVERWEATIGRLAGEQTRDAQEEGVAADRPQGRVRKRV